MFFYLSYGDNLFYSLKKWYANGDDFTNRETSKIGLLRGEFNVQESMYLLEIHYDNR